MPDMQTTPSPAAPRAASYSDLATVRNRIFDEITVGETVETKIINVDRKNRKIALSIKAKDVQDEKEAMKALKEQEAESAPTTIGDLIKAQMESGKGRAE